MRDTKEYLLAEKIVFLQNALDTANMILNNNGMLGVMADSTGVNFRNASKHHKKIRNVLKDIY